MYSPKISKLEEIIHSFDLEKLAKQTNFSIRNSGKINATNFVLSFYKLMIGRCYRLRVWASVLSSLINDSVSFQAISKKLTFRHIEFAKQLLHISLLHSVDSSSILSKDLPFTRVLVEDSTCITLTDSLFEFFPGSSNQILKRNAVCRVQLRVDLLSNSYESVSLQSYRDHDGSFADDVLGSIRTGDLILRDLGYYKFDVYEKIHSLGAYFISRYKPRAIIYDLDGNRLSLHQFLLKQDSRSNRMVDIAVKLGKNKTETRLVCLKLSDEQIKQRRRKAKRNGNRKNKHFKETMYLYSWNIMITNIKCDTVNALNIYQLYRLRWSIELIFKQWKSNLRIDKILGSAQGKNYIKPEMLLYLSLSFISLIVIPQVNRFNRLVFETYNRHLSIYKFTKSIMHSIEYILGGHKEKVLELLYKNCCYDRRKDQNHLAKILILKKLG